MKRCQTLSKRFPACSIGVIGGADGPTAVYVTSRLSPVAIAAGAATAAALIAAVAVGVYRKRRRGLAGR